MESDNMIQSVSKKYFTFNWTRVRSDLWLPLSLWVMGTTTAYARQGTFEIVHWPSPVWFGTNVTPSGKVVPMKKHRHSCKYSAAVDLKVWFARGAIELPGKEST